MSDFFDCPGNFLEWRPDGGAYAAKDIPPHTLVFIEPALACSPHVLTSESFAPITRAFPVDATFPQELVSKGKPFVPVAQLVCDLRRKGVTDANVEKRFRLKPREASYDGETPLIRAVLANKFMMRCEFSSAVIGDAIYESVSKIAHDCRPNAVYAFGTVADIYVATGAEPVPRGTQLTISHVGAHFAQTTCACARGGILSRKFGTQCQCNSCVASWAGVPVSGCIEHDCISTMRKSHGMTDAAWASAITPFSGLSNHANVMEDIMTQWNTKRRVYMRFPTMVDQIARRAALHASHFHDMSTVFAEMLRDMAAVLTQVVPEGKSSVLPEYLLFQAVRVGRVPQQQGTDELASVGFALHAATRDLIFAVAKRSPWMQDIMDKFFDSTAAVADFWPLHFRNTWQARNITQDEWRAGFAQHTMAAAGDGGRGAFITMLQQLDPDSLMRMAQGIGIDLMAYRGGDDKEGMVEAIADKLAHAANAV